MSAFSNMLEIFRPSMFENRRKRLLDQRNMQVEKLLGSAPSEMITGQQAFQADTFSDPSTGFAEDPAMLSGQPTPGLMSNIVEKKPGSGLLGGQMSPTEFYGRLLMVPGMEEVAGRGLLGLQDMQSRVALETLKQQANGQAGPFEGSGMDAQTFNQIIAYNKKVGAGQRTTPDEDMAYALAYGRASRPERYTDSSGNLFERPPMDLSQFVTPKTGARQQGQQGTQPTQLAIPPKLKEARIKFDQVEAAVDKYEKLLKEHGPSLFDISASSDLGTAYQDLMLELKELFNLGVLQGPDLEIMQKTVTDPTSIKGYTMSQLTEKDIFAPQIAQMREKLKNARSSHERQYPTGKPATNDPLGIRK